MPGSSHLIATGLIDTYLDDINLNKKSDNKLDDKSVNCCLYFNNYLLCCFICLN